MTPAVHAAGRPGLLQLFKPYWYSRQRWRAWLLVALSLTIMFGTAYLYVWANQLAGQLTDALLGRKWDTLRTVMITSVSVGIGVGAISVVNTAVSSLLDIGWRTWLTDYYLEQWFSSHAYYDIEREAALSNTDQRIAEDVKLFVDQTINITTSLISVIVNVGTFSFLLWSLSGTLNVPIGGMLLAIPGYMVYVAYAYNTGSLMLVHWVGKRLVGLTMEKQTVEADYRYGAMQVRENAEQIAFYGGDRNELLRLRQRYAKIRQNFLATIVRVMKVDMTRNIYGHLFATLPTLVALPRYLAGEITMGGVTRIAGAYGSLSATLAFFSQAYQGWASWLALANRLRDLSWAINKAHARNSGFSVARAEQADISSGPLQLRTPHGHLLAEVAPLRLAPGRRTLVRGPSGTGKSTLLRALAGLWPHGAGDVTVPADAHIMFLPQRSYLPSGSFKAAMCYPMAPEQFDDAECHHVLAACDLATRIPSLSASDSWQQLLSGGEQQRVAFARVLLQRPDFVFLDEATSALDPATEARLYQVLIAELPGSAIISVAHRAAVADYHDAILELTPSAPDHTKPY